ncbi:MAG: hypothetical protein D3908_00890 [Candidatus Electrothrix sp. AUS4]|nr:hypothetical protein [Candidatus Electrothrix sp. AUS4]
MSIAAGNRIELIKSLKLQQPNLIRQKENAYPVYLIEYSSQTAAIWSDVSIHSFWMHSWQTDSTTI